MHAGLCLKDQLWFTHVQTDVYCLQLGHQRSAVGLGRRLWLTCQLAGAQMCW